MPLEFTLSFSALLSVPEAGTDCGVALPSGFQIGLVRGSLVTKKKKKDLCYGLNVCTPKIHSYFEALVPNVIVTGSGEFGRQLGLERSRGWGPHDEIYALITRGRDRRSLSLSVFLSVSLSPPPSPSPSPSPSHSLM